MRLSVVHGENGFPALHCESVATLVEDIGNAGLNPAFVRRNEEGNSNKTGCVCGFGAGNPIWEAFGFVVKSGVKVPCPSGFVLKRPVFLNVRPSQIAALTGRK